MPFIASATNKANIPVTSSSQALSTPHCNEQFQATQNQFKSHFGRTSELSFFREYFLHLEAPAFNIISISGQGGVGKSTLLNWFIEEAKAHAEKSGNQCLIALVDERQAGYSPVVVMETLATQLNKIASQTGQPTGQPTKGRSQEEAEANAEVFIRFQAQLETYRENNGKLQLLNKIAKGEPAAIRQPKLKPLTPLDDAYDLKQEVERNLLTVTNPLERSKLNRELEILDESIERLEQEQKNRRERLEKYVGGSTEPPSRLDFSQNRRFEELPVTELPRNSENQTASLEPQPSDISRQQQIANDLLRKLTNAFVEYLNLLAVTMLDEETEPNGQPSDQSKQAEEVSTPAHQRLLLCFDTFEQLAPEIAPWLVDFLLQADISDQVVLIIAGRDPLDRTLPKDPKRWLPYRDAGQIYFINLDVFSPEATDEYLKVRGISEPEHLANFRQLSGGLPLYLSLLTFNSSGQASEVDPTSDVVENFLRWEWDETKRRLALDVALLSRPFNQDELEPFGYLAQVEAKEQEAIFRWLTRSPFVKCNPQDGRYNYHSLVQELFNRYLFRRSRQNYYNTRRMLANYYRTQLELLEATRNTPSGRTLVFQSTEWLELVLALIQQLLWLPEEVSQNEALTLVLHAYHSNFHFSEEELPTPNDYTCGEIARVLREHLRLQKQYQPLERGQPNGQPNDQPSDQPKSLTGTGQTLEYLLVYIEAELQSKELFTAATYLIETVIATISATLPAEDDLPKYLHSWKNTANRSNYQDTKILAHLYRRRGDASLAHRRLGLAMDDYEWTITLNPSDAVGYLNLASIYRQAWQSQSSGETGLHPLHQHDPSVSSYHEHVVDIFRRAVECNPNAEWAYVQRGIAYRDVKKYDLALVDFERALALNSNSAFAYAQRGITYRNQEQFERAIADFDKALALNPRYSWAYTQRGILYRLIGNYDQALLDFYRALELNPSSSWASAQRAIVYGETD
ncbi:MAG: tetratricopeptide repeat protein [Chloroflexi bacterium]|nr:tetratricopeptide repeat protein [Chloroflexota bacterium]